MLHISRILSALMIAAILISGDRIIFLLVSGDMIDDEVSSVLKDLEYLYSRGFDIGNLSRRINDIIWDMDRDPGNATYIIRIREIHSKIISLKGEAERLYIINNVIRYSAAAFIGVLPVIIYYLLPRIYLYIWFHTRRGWVVRRRSR